MKPSILRLRIKLESLVDIGSLDGPSYKYLQMLAVIAVLSVWYLETSTGLISWWDAYAYPVVAVVLGGGALVAIFSPAHIPGVRLITVGAVNALMVYELHMILWHAKLVDIYQISATLQWIPLAFGLSYLFLNNRAALALTSGVLVYETISFASRIPLLKAGVDVPDYFPTLLWNAIISQLMYASLLIAIVYIKLNARDASNQAHIMSLKAHTDTLTGVLNRRGLDRRLEQVASNIQSDGQTAIFMIDVDHFKTINDIHGHQAGDLVLVELSRLMASLLRGHDVVGRWGGEEFMVVAPGATRTQAVELAERLRTAVQRHHFVGVGSLTISVGIAELFADTSLDATLEAADAALYAAKRGGRNRVELH